MPDLSHPLLVSFLALTLASLALGAPSLLRRLPRATTPAFAAVALTALFALANAPRFDPYWTAIFGATTWAALEALASVPAGKPIGGVDVAVWLLLWIPFDLRWNYTLFVTSVGGHGSSDFAYNWWAPYLVVVGAIGWGRLRELPGFDFRLAPRARDLVAAGPAYVGILVLCLPVALAKGFCEWPGANFHGDDPMRMLKEAAIAGPLIFVTIAVPEELFFRGVLQGGLEKKLGKPWQAIAIASVAFGLMHWNNTDTTLGRLDFSLLYFGLATVAGACYGIAYRKGGSLLACSLAHMAVDLSWHMLFQRR